VVQVVHTAVVQEHIQREHPAVVGLLVAHMEAHQDMLVLALVRGGEPRVEHQELYTEQLQAVGKLETDGLMVDLGIGETGEVDNWDYSQLHKELPVEEDFSGLDLEGHRTVLLGDLGFSGLEQEGHHMEFLGDLGFSGLGREGHHMAHLGDLGSFGPGREDLHSVGQQLLQVVVVVLVGVFGFVAVVRSVGVVRENRLHYVADNALHPGQAAGAGQDNCLDRMADMEKLPELVLVLVHIVVESVDCH
jgi:hypothetical protein